MIVIHYIIITGTRIKLLLNSFGFGNMATMYSWWEDFLYLIQPLRIELSYAGGSIRKIKLQKIISCQFWQMDLDTISSRRSVDTFQFPDQIIFFKEAVVGVTFWQLLCGFFFQRLFPREASWNIHRRPVCAVSECGWQSLISLFVLSSALLLLQKNLNHSFVYSSMIEYYEGPVCEMLQWNFMFITFLAC